MHERLSCCKVRDAAMKSPYASFSQRGTANPKPQHSHPTRMESNRQRRSITQGEDRNFRKVPSCKLDWRSAITERLRHATGHEERIAFEDIENDVNIVAGNRSTNAKGRTEHRRRRRLLQHVHADSQSEHTSAKRECASEVFCT